MNDRVDRSRGIVTLMTEALVNINPIEPLRLDKQATRMNPIGDVGHTLKLQ